MDPDITNATRKRELRESSGLVNPKDFLQSWNYEAFQAIKSPRIAPNKNPLPQIHDEIKKMMDIPDDTLAELSEICG